MSLLMRWGALAATLPAARFVTWLLAYYNCSIDDAFVALHMAVWEQWDGSKLSPGRGVDIPSSLLGHTVLITGGTSGVGLGAAINFYRRGAHVALTGRVQDNADDGVRLVMARCPDSPGRVTALSLQLAHYDEIRKFAKDVAKRLPPLNTLVLNAGIGGAELKKGQHVNNRGLSTIYIMNYLGHFVLAKRLLTHLAKGATVISMTSWSMWAATYAHMFSPPVTFGYAGSKLALYCHSLALRRRLRGRGMAYALHPGMVNSTLQWRRPDNPCLPPHHHAPCFSEEQAGLTVLQSAFITRTPPPEALYGYWFGRLEILAHWAPREKAQERHKIASSFAFTERYQRQTYGLHGNIGPECDEELQEQLWLWSVNQTGG